MTEARRLGGSHHDSPGGERVRAAQYVRMSTEHQQYSTENQADVIRLAERLHGRGQA